MDTGFNDSVRRLLIRLEDARREVGRLTEQVEYPRTAKLERAYDAIEVAERYLREVGE